MRQWKFNKYMIRIIAQLDTSFYDYLKTENVSKKRNYIDSTQIMIIHPKE